MDEKLLKRALRMLLARAIYWDSRDPSSAVAYSSAVSILTYAMIGDVEKLDQMDYYKVED